MIWERVTVRRLLDGSFIGEARLHARFAVGSISKSPFDALTSASEAMDKEIVDLRAKASKRAVIPTPDDEELL